VTPESPEDLGGPLVGGGWEVLGCDPPSQALCNFTRYAFVILHAFATDNPKRWQDRAEKVRAVDAFPHRTSDARVGGNRNLHIDIRWAASAAALMQQSAFP